MDDDFVLVDEKAPEAPATELLQAVTNKEPKAAKAPRKKRPSEIAKAAAKAAKPKAEPKAEKPKKTTPKPKGGFRDTKAKPAKVTIAKGKKKPKAKPVKRVKTKAAKPAVKPTNLEGLTRTRSRQRNGSVAQGMARGGDMAQVTLTFPPKQLAQMRAFASKGKISMSEAARQIVTLGLKK
jgi:hypothetical protein